MTTATIPYFEDQNAKLIPDQPTIERNTINAIVYHPATDEVLCLDWPKLKVKTFILGGIENDEDPLTAARREMKEETGYKNLKFISEVGKTKSAFYAAHKSENRVSHNVGLLFELTDTEQDKVLESESMHHEMKWIPKNEVMSFLNVDSQKYIWERALELLNQKSVD